MTYNNEIYNKEITYTIKLLSTIAKCIKQRFTKQPLRKHFRGESHYYN